MDELQTEILRRKSLLEEAAVKTFTEYNQIVSKTRVRMRQIVAVVYAFNSLRELFCGKVSYPKILRKAQKIDGGGHDMHLQKCLTFGVHIIWYSYFV